MLIIRRLNQWDLPKGKIESGENTRDAAVREVEEECGISGITVLKALPSTFHTYKLKNSHVLKETHWFLMETNYSGELIPQEEEGITEAKWLSQDKLLQTFRQSYSSLQWLLKEYLMNHA